MIVYIFFLRNKRRIQPEHKAGLIKHEGGKIENIINMLFTENFVVVVDNRLFKLNLQQCFSHHI